MKVIHQILREYHEKRQYGNDIRIRRFYCTYPRIFSCDTFSEASSAVKVTEGSIYNEWSFDLDASGFDEDEYIVNVKAVETDAAATTTFNILSGSSDSETDEGNDMKGMTLRE